jgi:hypothetical protein
VRGANIEEEVGTRGGVSIVLSLDPIHCHKLFKQKYSLELHLSTTDHSCVCVCGGCVSASAAFFSSTSTCF